MSKHRIVEHTCVANTQYEVQKSFLGFWYNFQNINADITGFYDTLEDAEEVINLYKKSDKKILMWQ